MRLLFLTVLSLLTFPLVLVRAAPPCSERLATLRDFLDHAAALIEQDIERVREDTTLAETTRGEFVQSSSWSAAWLRDQSVRAGAMEECADLPQRLNDIHAQLLPVVLLSWNVQVSRLTWQLDLLSRALDTESIADPEHQDGIAQARLSIDHARLLLREAYGAATPDQVRLAIRRTLALAHQGLRMLRFRGILE